MILIIKHISIEGPGTIGEFFKNTSWEVTTCELDKGGILPDDLSKVEAVIILGGSMNVYEEEKYPFLKTEDRFLKQAIQQEIPILGICLGAQLLAKACGAKVRKTRNKEIGWYMVHLTEEGGKDLFFDGVDKEFNVFQQHEDTFALPEKATLLTTAPVCGNQAFRVGRRAYGLQFHIEVTDCMIKDWIGKYLESPDIQLQLEGRQMLIDYYQIKEEFDRQANRMYLNFSKIIASREITV